MRDKQGKKKKKKKKFLDPKCFLDPNSPNLFRWFVYDRKAGNLRYFKSEKDKVRIGQAKLGQVTFLDQKCF